MKKWNATGGENLIILMVFGLGVPLGFAIGIPAMRFLGESVGFAMIVIGMGGGALGAGVLARKLNAGRRAKGSFGWASLEGATLRAKRGRKTKEIDLRAVTRMVAEYPAVRGSLARFVRLVIEQGDTVVSIATASVPRADCPALGISPCDFSDTPGMLIGLPRGEFLDALDSVRAAAGQTEVIGTSGSSK